MAAVLFVLSGWFGMIASIIGLVVFDLSLTGAVLTYGTFGVISLVICIAIWSLPTPTENREPQSA